MLTKFKGPINYKKINKSVHEVLTSFSLNFLFCDFLKKFTHTIEIRKVGPIDPKKNL